MGVRQGGAREPARTAIRGVDRSCGRVTYCEHRIVDARPVVWAVTPETPRQVSVRTDDEVAADASEEVVAEAAAPDGAPAAGDPMPCGELSQAKYPFLSCVRSEAGHPVLAVEGAGVTGAQLVLTSDYVDGAGSWGASGIE